MKFDKIKNINVASRNDFFKSNIYWKLYWKHILANLIASFSVVTVLVSLTEHLFKIPQLQNNIMLSVSILIAIVYSFFNNIPKYFHSEKIRDRNNCYIDLIIGDIFKEQGDLVIPTNTTFDTTDKFISPKSLQWQTCQKYFNGDIKKLDSKLIKALINYDFEYLIQRPIGKKKKYGLNCIAKIRHENDTTSYWLPISDFNNDGNIIYESINIKQSIDNLWKFFKENNGNVRSICLPALGTGLTPLNIPQIFIIEYIIDSYILQSKDRVIARRLKIVLYPKDKNTNVYKDFDYLAKYLHTRCQNPNSISKFLK